MIPILLAPDARRGQHGQRSGEPDRRLEQPRSRRLDPQRSADRRVRGTAADAAGAGACRCVGRVAAHRHRTPVRAERRRLGVSRTGADPDLGGEGPHDERPRRHQDVQCDLLSNTHHLDGWASASRQVRAPHLAGVLDGHLAGQHAGGEDDAPQALLPPAQRGAAERSGHAHRVLHPARHQLPDARDDGRGSRVPHRAARAEPELRARRQRDTGNVPDLDRVPGQPGNRGAAAWLRAAPSPGHQSVPQGVLRRSTASRSRRRAPAPRRCTRSIRSSCGRCCERWRQARRRPDDARWTVANRHCRVRPLHRRRGTRQVSARRPPDEFRGDPSSRSSRWPRMCT